MGFKQKIRRKLNDFIYWNFEVDRVGERKVKKSIEVWHRKGWINQTRARFMWNKIRKTYNCDIHPSITCGKDLRLEHLMGVSIGKTAVLGEDVRLYYGVQIIAKVTGDEERKLNKERRHAKIGNHVVLGNCCTIIGPVTIGDDCIIGARAIVTHDVPPHSVVIGTNQIRPKREDEKAPAYKTDKSILGRIEKLI